ncbi:unnamed protein product [Adineta ricciae]|uniref:Fibronectin type-III domain-containing protein n=1 Tax=Adineta ricciae TaxID=249248 RepID=A0A814FXL9_ADIRI|nr:unnamed protein product [Adineta ricciae]
MITGAEQCLDDYHYIRSKIDVVSKIFIHGQEEQLSRILRMLDQDDVILNGHLAATSLGRPRSNSRSYDFNRTCLPGNIAYLRLREREQEDLKRRSLSSSTYVSRRPYERRRRISEQGNDFLMSKCATRQTLRKTGLDSFLLNSETRRRVDDDQTSDSLMSRSALARQRTKEQNTDSRLSTSAAQRSIIEQEYDSLRSKYATRQRPSGQDGDASLSNAAIQQQANERANDSFKSESASRKRKDERNVDSFSSDLASQQQAINEGANSVLSNTDAQKQIDKKGKDLSATKYASEQQKEIERTDLSSSNTAAQKKTDKKEKDLSSANSAHDQQKERESSDLSSSNAIKQKQTSNQTKNLSSAKSDTQTDQDGQIAELLPSSSTDQKQKQASTEEKSSKEKPVVQDEKQEQSKKDAEVKNRKAKASNVEAEESNADDEYFLSQAYDLLSFVAHYEESSSDDQSQENQDSLGYLVCEWTTPKLPSSSTPIASAAAAIDHFTIERQFGGQNWLPLGEKIDTAQNKIELGLSSLLDEQIQENIPSSYRLKAHFKSGKTWTSKPTNEINVDSLASGRFIKPDVEILSPNSVQLTWQPTGDEKTTKYHIEKKESHQKQWTKVSTVSLLQDVAQIDDLTDAEQCEFRLVPSKLDENESELLTVQNVNEWLRSLHIEPISANIVDIDISEEGFKQFDQYKVEYAAMDQPDQWNQVSNITRDAAHLTIEKLRAGVDYKFRLTPILRGSATAKKDAISSQLSLVLDVKMPLTRKGRLMKNEIKSSEPPTQFAIHQTDPKTVFIEAILPSNKPALFEDIFDVYSKKDTANDDWVKVGTIDKDHLNMTIKNLPENTAYTFKIHNQSAPSSDEQSNIVQEFNFETASVKLYDPSLFLEKVEKTLESVVSGVMQAAAGHQPLDDPLNISLNDVIQKLFKEEDLVPNEQYGFDTLALSEDLQLFHGPKQMMLQQLTIDETSESSKHDGEIIIHNYRKAEHELQPVTVREEHGNTRIGNIDGDVIIRNVVTDVLLTNDQKRNQLSMNIVGQAFLKRVQGTLTASKFKGIIVVKNVDRP